jgi:hypothetical protein
MLSTGTWIRVPRANSTPTICVTASVSTTLPTPSGVAT